MKYFKSTIWAVFIVLAIVNIFIFIKSIKISTEISFYENQIKSLKQDNLALEKNAYGFDSLQYAASVAANLKFNKKAETIIIENVVYALK